MPVTWDAASESTAGTGGVFNNLSSTSWTHSTAITPRGVLIFTFVADIYNVNTDRVTSVTYGGVNVPAVSGGRAVGTTKENVTRDVKAWFLGSGIPTGNQTVVINRTNNGSGCFATAVTFNADSNTSVTGVSLATSAVSSLSQVNVDDGSPGVSSLRLGAINTECGTGPGQGFIYINDSIKYLSQNVLAGANSVWVNGTANNAGNGIGIASARLLSGNNEILDQFITYDSNFGVVRETSNGQGSRPVGFQGSYTTLPPAPSEVSAVYLAVREGGGGGSVEPAKLPFVLGNRVFNLGRGVAMPF